MANTVLWFMDWKVVWFHYAGKYNSADTFSWKAISKLLHQYSDNQNWYLPSTGTACACMSACAHTLTFLILLHYSDHRNTCYRNCCFIPNQDLRSCKVPSPSHRTFLLIVPFSPIKINSSRSTNRGSVQPFVIPSPRRHNFTLSLQWHNWWINHWSPKTCSPTLMLTLFIFFSWSRAR